LDVIAVSVFLGIKKASLAGGLGTRGEGRRAYITTTTTSHVRDGRAFVVNTLFSVSGKWPFGNCGAMVHEPGLVVTSTLRARLAEALIGIGLAMVLCTRDDGKNCVLGVATNPRTWANR
jgi:hypothetical protein